MCRLFCIDIGIKSIVVLRARTGLFLHLGKCREISRPGAGSCSSSYISFDRLPLLNITQMYTLPLPQSLPSLSDPERVEVLNHLFEPCPTLSQILLPRVFTQPYASYRAFIDVSRSTLLNYLKEQEAQGTVSPEIAKIVSAHPRLGPSKDKLSSHSTSEQRSLLGTEEEAKKLAEWNKLYEATFPGLRYVVFVNGRSREEIMENMKSRIERGDIKLEREEAFNAMCDIALDRAKKLEAKL